MDLSRLVPVIAVLGVCVIASLVVGLVAESPAPAPEVSERQLVGSDEFEVLPTPTPFAIDASPVTLRDLGFSEAAQFEIAQAHWPPNSCDAAPIVADGWSQRLDADLDGDGIADVVRLRAGPVINPGRGLIEMAVEFGDGRVHQGRLHDHRLGVQTVSEEAGAARQARPVRLDGVSRDVILFTNPDPQLDVSAGPTSWVIGMAGCRPVLLADAGVKGEAWCPAGRDRETRIEFPAWRLRSAIDGGDLAVLLPSCEAQD